MSAKLQALRIKKTGIEQDTDSSKSIESLSGPHNDNDSVDEDEDSVSEAIEDEEEESDAEENVGHGDDTVEDMMFICEALGDFTTEEKSDLPFKKGDSLRILGIRPDGWWEAENQNGNKGMVPSTFLKVPENFKNVVQGMQVTPENSMRSHLWNKLRRTLKQSHTVEEAVTSIGGFPIGFCHASLGQLLKNDSRYGTEAFLIPKLSDSGLSFRDLQWNIQTKSLKPIPTHLQRVVRLVAFRQVHPPGSDFNVTSRHVRICLHDGAKVLSNVHTIKAKWDPKTPKLWTFMPKVSSSGSSIEEGQFFIRSNSSSPTIGVLFQLCVNYNKLTTGESGEMSCGWVFMRLLNDSGLAVPNRTKVLNIHLGVPFMNQSSSPLGPKSGALKHLINLSKKPRLVVSIATLKRKTDQLLHFLPSTLLSTVSSIPLLVLYRKILAARLLRDRIAFESTELIHSPFLCNFPKTFSYPDIIDVFRKLWNEKSKRYKQSYSKDEEIKKMNFQQLFMETAFLILQCDSFLSFDFLSAPNEEEGKLEIQKFLKDIKDHGPLYAALSSDYHFRPLSMSNLTFDIIGQYCLPIEGIE